MPASVTECITLREAAALTGGRLEGEGDLVIRRPAPLETAQGDELAPLAERRFLDAARTSRAGAFLVSEALAEALDDSRPRVVVADAREALLPLLERLVTVPIPAPPGVHPTAVLGKGVRLADGVRIGPYAVLGDGVAVGAGTQVGAHCVLGPGARIGGGCRLHPHVVLYPGTVLGDRVEVHAGARLGSDGFGYVRCEGAYRKVPQVGGCVLEDDVEVGANSCVDRGALGDTVVGRGSKLDNLVHVAHNVHLGQGVAMAALSGIAGSTTVGAGAQFGGQAGAVGHLRIGAGARIAAQAGVIGDVEEGAEVAGYPARDLRRQMRASAAGARLPEALGRLRALERQVAALRARLEGGGEGA
ncbi:MAG: UDP-3-O-(3-hydroxymyristoyl)glucosamine N-acyltransferase [Longimicrobiales bacterium]|nr:UDP-3-O-(3-hydroxymyristoyl)glucosamine N-acyltransferase [Longimicrobiales bacterium]